MREMPPEIEARFRKIVLEMIGTMSEVNVAMAKLQFLDMFNPDKLTKEEAGIMRDTSDSMIRSGSLLRRICDLTEPFLDD